jgi:hypothetical protein
MSDVDDPADTRMMGIVHAALLRDLARARDVLAADPPAGGSQRRELGRHIVWMMEFLHAHHHSEDAGLWPALLARDPAARDLVESLEQDHADISPRVDAVVSAASSYATSTVDETRQALSRELEGLEEVLVPHLGREVAEAMPVVARTLTRGEWQDIEQKFNLASKSMRQLAMEGHWLLDGLDAEGRDVVVHLVPAVPRLILVHGFARAYRRAAAARWTPVAPAPRVSVR